MRILGIGSLLVLAGACTLGNDPAELPYCEDVATALAMDEVSPLGFSGADVLAFAAGTKDETLVYARRGVDDTPLTLELGSVDGARFVQSTAVYPDEGGVQADIGVVCDDRVEVDVAVELITADGAFDEAWQGALVAISGDAASTRHELDPDALGGTYDMDVDIDVADYDARSLWVEIQLDAIGTSGAIRGQVSGEEDCTSGDCAAWSSEVVVGTWGGE